MNEVFKTTAPLLFPKVHGRENFEAVMATARALERKDGRDVRQWEDEMRRANEIPGNKRGRQGDTGDGGGCGGDIPDFFQYV